MSIQRTAMKLSKLDQLHGRLETVFLAHVREARHQSRQLASLMAAHRPADTITGGIHTLPETVRADAYRREALRDAAMDSARELRWAMTGNFTSPEKQRGAKSSRRAAKQSRHILEDEALACRFWKWLAKFHAARRAAETIPLLSFPEQIGMRAMAQEARILNHWPLTRGFVLVYGGQTLEFLSALGEPCQFRTHLFAVPAGDEPIMVTVGQAPRGGSLYWEPARMQAASVEVAAPVTATPPPPPPSISAGDAAILRKRAAVWRRKKQRAGQELTGGMVIVHHGIAHSWSHLAMLKEPQDYEPGAYGVTENEGPIYQATGGTYMAGATAWTPVEILP